MMMSSNPIRQRLVLRKRNIENKKKKRKKERNMVHLATNKNGSE